MVILVNFERFGFVVVAIGGGSFIVVFWVFCFSFYSFF